ncbi:molybdate ABC transporter substrate-binding protein [Nitratifractor sp.]
MYRLLFSILLLGALLPARPLTVAVAANVGYAIADLQKAFVQEHPGASLRIILGSSGKLTAQIRRGAPYDLFLSADMEYPRALYERGLSADPPRIYAKGLLALLIRHPRQSPPTLEELSDPSIGRIAIPNPRTAPYGRAAVGALKKAGLYEKLKKKFIYGESVSQTVTYALRAADAGLIAKSALFAPQLRRFREGKEWAEVPRSFYRAIDQGVILLKGEASGGMAKAFYDFLFSPKGREIFRRYGYELP